MKRFIIILLSLFVFLTFVPAGAQPTPEELFQFLRYSDPVLYEGWEVFWEWDPILRQRIIIVELNSEEEGKLFQQSIVWQDLIKDYTTVRWRVKKDINPFFNEWRPFQFNECKPFQF